MTVGFDDPPTLNVSSVNITFLGNTDGFQYEAAIEAGGSEIGNQPIIQGDNILDLSTLVPPPNLGGFSNAMGSNAPNHVAWSCGLSSVFKCVAFGYPTTWEHIETTETFWVGPLTQIQGSDLQSKWFHTLRHPSSGCRRPAYQNAGRKTLHHDEPGHLFDMEVPWPLAVGLPQEAT